jgi:hypothetical protein
VLTSTQLNKNPDLRLKVSSSSLSDNNDSHQQQFNDEEQNNGQLNFGSDPEQDLKNFIMNGPDPNYQDLGVKELDLEQITPELNEEESKCKDDNIDRFMLN